jgi:hypothetical protein
LLNRLKDEEVNLQAIDHEIKQINQDLKSLE